MSSMSFHVILCYHVVLLHKDISELSFVVLCSCFRANKHVTNHDKKLLTLNSVTCFVVSMCLVSVKLFGVFQPAPKM